MENQIIIITKSKTAWEEMLWEMRFTMVPNNMMVCLKKGEHRFSIDKSYLEKVKKIAKYSAINIQTKAWGS